MMTAPKLVPPKRFSYHNERIVRSRYPDTAGVNFIAELGIRKFISLGVGFPGTPERNIGKANKIELTHYPISIGAYEESRRQLEEQITQVIDYICVKNSGSRIYIYDDDGYSIIGAVCGILRRIEGWSIMSAVDECYRFYPAGRFDFDVADLIGNFDITKWH